MAASSGSRALLLMVTAAVLTVGGFFLGRRLSESEPSPGTASAPPTPPAAPGETGGWVMEAPAGASPQARTGDISEESGPESAAEPGPPAGSRSAPAARGSARRARSALASPGPAAAPREPESRPAQAPPPRPMINRAFVAGLTQIGSSRSSSADLKGFDPSAVELKRAPRSEGFIEFEVTPSRLVPGQPYAVKVYLRNQGEKPIQIKELTIASELNGQSSRGSISPRSKQVAPSLVGLLAELPGVWKEGVTSWSLEVEVLTSAGDTYSNRMAWK